jgi:hypothetical protein
VSSRIPRAVRAITPALPVLQVHRDPVRQASARVCIRPGTCGYAAHAGPGSLRRCRNGATGDTDAAYCPLHSPESAHSREQWVRRFAKEPASVPRQSESIITGMSLEPAPLCDEHMTPMYPEEPLTQSVVYGCRSANCRHSGLLHRNFSGPGGSWESLCKCTAIIRPARQLLATDTVLDFAYDY